jgi:hypothetical protein
MVPGMRFLERPGPIHGKAVVVIDVQVATPVAENNQKFFAELFFKKATSSLRCSRFDPINPRMKLH